MCPIKKKAGDACRRGYTLLEVLVALITVSLFLTIMLPATLASLKRIELSSKKDRALFLAKSKIEWLSTLPGVDVGTAKGETDGLLWEVTVTDLSNISPAIGANIGVSLRGLNVRVMEGKSASPLAVVSAQRLYVSRRRDDAR